MKKTVLLVVLDGWGIGAKNETNPLYVANPKNIAYIKSHYPSGALQASGIAVGLPWEEEGNSEVGHLTIGSGRVIYQHYPKITLAIRNGSFFENPVLKAATAHARQNNSALNFAGLLTQGNVHASLEHLRALIKLAEAEGFPDVRLHLFADGKDSPPKSLPVLLGEVPKEKIASISGRYYAMDRDMHWDRTEKAYNALTGSGASAPDYEGVIKKHLARDLSEEFVEPMLVGATPKPIKDNDSLVFFNFREDSIRQITAAFIQEDFGAFPRKKLSNLFVATMTTYSDKFDVPAVFPTERIDTPLAKVLSDAGKLQVHIAETEKYAHVTYFFNGYKDAPFKNEYRVLVPSKNVPRHEDHPEMMAREITTRAAQALDERAFDFIVINFANADIIAHTGNYDAAIQAIAVLDECVGVLAQKTIETGATMIVTADHGNIEQMIYPLTGQPETKHNTSPVPVYLIAREYAREHSRAEIEQSESQTAGIISDIAPTILEILGIPKPAEMTGESLIPTLSYY